MDYKLENKKKSQAVIFTVLDLRVCTCKRCDNPPLVNKSSTAVMQMYVPGSRLRLTHSGILQGNRFCNDKHNQSQIQTSHNLHSSYFRQCKFRPASPKAKRRRRSFMVLKLMCDDECVTAFITEGCGRNFLTA